MENQTKIILDSIADGVFTVDSRLKITSLVSYSINLAAAPGGKRPP